MKLFKRKPTYKMEFIKNELINNVLGEYYATFEKTLDTSDYVPKKYNDKVYRFIYKNLKKKFKEINFSYKGLKEEFIKGLFEEKAKAEKEESEKKVNEKAQSEQSERIKA